MGSIGGKVCSAERVECYRCCFKRFGNKLGDLSLAILLGV